MKILMVLDYFTPHISGLTLYVKRLSEELVKSGNQVTVLTSRYDRKLPDRETHNGVTIVREWVLIRFFKAVLMPLFPCRVFSLMRQHDAVVIHLPQLEAAVASLIAKFVFRKTVILTYHCDIQLPANLMFRLAEQILQLGNNIGANLADRIVAYTEDYRDHSPFLSAYRDKVVIIPPPIQVDECSQDTLNEFQKKFDLKNKTVIGMATRFAEEKGIEFVLSSLEDLKKQFSNIHLLFAGDYQNVIGEQEYYLRLTPLIEKHRNEVTFTGVLKGDEMSCFYRSIQVLIVASINSTESFGLVQAEAMLHGVPVIATNLPGVRVPVQNTGMGRIIPTEDSQALTETITEVLRNREKYVRSKEEVKKLFGTGNNRRLYEDLLRQLIN